MGMISFDYVENPLMCVVAFSDHVRLGCDSRHLHQFSTYPTRLGKESAFGKVVSGFKLLKLLNEKNLTFDLKYDIVRLLNGYS